MRGATRPPNIKEVMDFIKTAAHDHACSKMNNSRFINLEGNTLFIGQGTGNQNHISLLPDGTVESSPRARETPLVNYTKGNVFYKAWSHLQNQAYEHITDSLAELIGPNRYQDQINPQNQLLANLWDDTTVQKTIKQTADHVAVTIGKRGYLRHPEALGYHLLHQLLGKERVAEAMKLMGHQTTLEHFNLLHGYPEIFREAMKTAPNAVTCWLGTRELAQNPLPATAGELVEQARRHFISQAAKRNPQADEPQQASLLWQAFLDLNTSAVSRFPNFRVNDLLPAAAAAQRAGVSPSYTAIQHIARKEGPIRERLNPEVAAAYAAASLNPPGKLTQRQLANIVELVAYHTGLGVCAQHKDQCLQADQDLQRKVNISRNLPRPLPLWELIRTFPQDLLDPSRHHQHLSPAKQKRSRSGKPRKTAARNPRPQTRDVLAILQALPPEVVREITRNPVTIENTPGARLALRVEGQPAPTLEVTRSPEGTISVTSTGYWTDGTILKRGNDPRQTAQRCRLTTRGLVSRTISERVADHLRENWTRLAGDAPFPSGNRVTAATRKFLQELPPSQKGPDDRETDRQIGQALETMISHEVTQALSSLDQQVTVSRYNTMNGIIDQLAHLQETNPGLLQWGLQYLEPTEPIRHPGQFVSMVQQHLGDAGLHPRYRRFVTRMPHHLLRAITRGSTDPTVAAGMCNALARAQAIPDASALDEMLEVLLPPWNTAPGDSLRTRNLQQATFVLAKHAIDTDGDLSTEVRRYLSSMVDYVLNISLDQQRVQSTTWNGLRQAAEAWHRRQQQQPTENRWRQLLVKQANHYRAWNSLLPQTEIQGFTCIPLTSEELLYQETEHMQHCVYGYGPDCAQGQSRIFSIRRNNQHVATTELTHSKSQWKVAQTRAKHNHEAPEEAHQAANRLALAYNREARKAGPSPHRDWWVQANTGEIQREPIEVNHQDHGPLPF